MLAMEWGGVYQTAPRLWKSPIISESWCHLYVSARRVWSHLRILVIMEALLRMEMEDWELRKIHFGSMPEAFCACASI